MTKQGDGTSLGRLLVEIVDCVSHRGGETLRIMAEARVTLQQVLLLTRLRYEGPSSVSDLAAGLNLSLPAISQAIDRLLAVGLVSRIEDPGDRRKKRLATTKKANALLGGLKKARASEYGAGFSALPAETQQDLETVLKAILRQLKTKANSDGDFICCI
jgi:DNA-binding MarR family transcriptional regulator